MAWVIWVDETMVHLAFEVPHSCESQMLQVLEFGLGSLWLNEKPCRSTYHKGDDERVVHKGGPEISKR